MTSQKISFRNDKGYDLIGVIDKPEGKGPFPAVINCHGFTGTKDVHFHPGLSRELCKKGFVALRFDFTGNGESEGEFSEGNITQEVTDIKKAVDLLSTLDYVDKERIGISGHSMGGAVVTYACTKDNRIKAVAALSPSVNWKEYVEQNFSRYDDELKRDGFFIYRKKHHDGTEREYKITKEFVDSRIIFNILKTIKEVKQPVLMLCGTDEGFDSSEELIRELFAEANKPKELEVIDGADHCYTKADHRKKVIRKVIWFFEKYL